LIEEISIRDLGVIREARLEFGRGLTVLTGETGAGKTMVLTALGLLLGERADSSAVRQGQEQASVEGRWLLPPDAEVLDRVVEAGGLCEQGELLLNRSVSVEGRSRAAAGGRSVPAGLLAELAEKLVVIHGQSDQLRLRSSAAQREALDSFAGDALAEVLSEFQAHHLAWRKATAELAEITSAQQNRTAELAELREAVEAIDEVSPQVGEDVALAEQADRLTYAEDIRLAVIAAHEALSSEAFDSLDAINRLGEARKFLEHVSSHDPQLEQQAQRLRQLGFELNDVAAALNGYLAGLDADSAMSLEAVQERRAKLNGLIRRFGPSLQEVIDYRERAGQRLLQLDNSEQTVDALTELVGHEHALVVEFGARLTELRRAAAASLSQKITTELAGLAMSGASVSVDVTAGDLTTTGFDQVAILLSAYPGAELRPVAKSASGGELSRIMLAIEVVLAGSEQAPTFIFDEVDAGVGGAAAIEVGKRLKQLAQTAQVIVVTHLAQVAAFANHHLRVNKTVGEEFTVSDVSSLTQDERVEELARMLSGLSDSSAAQSHARELLLLGETA